MNPQPRIYNIGLLNDLHYYFPELLYRPERFQSVQDVLRYIGEVAAQNPYERNRQAYLRSTTSTSSASSSSSSSSSASRVRRGFQPMYQRSSNLSSLFSGSPYMSNVRVNIPLSSLSGASSASSSSNTISDQLISSLLSGVFSGDSQIGSLADLYIHILQQGENSSESSVPSQDDVYRATSIPTVHDVVDGTCSICQEPCQPDGPMCRKINHCGHLFHLTCIDTWFQSHSTCPMCRYDIRQG